MRKITFLFLILFASLSYGQTCNQQFEVEGYDDDPTVLTVNASDLTCAVGTVNSITILDAVLDDYWAYIFGDTYCLDYYSFELNIDGVVSTVCADDLIGMDITNFTTFTITSIDLDEFADEVWMAVLIQVDYTATEAPECTTVTAPITETEVSINGVLEWDAVPGAAGYIVSVGTTSGGTDILSLFDVGDETTYDLPGSLEEGTEYFVNVTPYNTIGQATGCTEYNFTVPVPPTGSNCADPIVVSTLPYNTTDDTANYFDTVYEGSPGASGCGSTNNYLNGNDVVYAYTATSDTSFTLTLDPTATYAGVFIYGSCDDIGTNCLAGAVSGSGSLPISIPEFPVTNGETYYIVISTWATPQTTGYTLDIIENTCVSAAATYTVVSDCDSGVDQFFVDVDVIDLGSATSLAINDNQSSPVEIVTATGVVQFGPYANGTSVIFTVENEQDSNCVLTSPARTQAVCPPSNDECTNAIALTAGGVFADNEIVATNVGATRNPADHDPTTVASTCDTYDFLVSGKDVWFNVVAPDSGTLTIETASNGGTGLTDTGLYVYRGASCSALTYEKCSADIGGGNNFSRVVLSDLTPGETITARVWGYSGTSGSFKISAFDASLSNQTFDLASLKAYPNPVKDVLNLSYTQNISQVSIFNLLGQQVLDKKLDASEAKLDMSNLAQGTYLVKVTVDNQVKTLKVVKQ